MFVKSKILNFQIMHKNLQLGFLLIFSLFFNCKTEQKSNIKSYSKSSEILKSDSIVVYIYDGLMGQSILDLKEKLDTTIVTELKLNNQQVIDLVTILEKKRLTTDDSLSYDEAACCSPHHGIVTYKQGKPDNSISICFDCNCINSSVDTEIRPAHLLKYFVNLHLKVGGKELVPVTFGHFDPDDEIKKLNVIRYGKKYEALRYGM
jgi:hypothetical protein